IKQQSQRSMYHKKESKREKRQEGLMPPIVIDTKYLCEVLPHPLGKYTLHNTDNRYGKTGLQRLYFKLRSNLASPVVTWHRDGRLYHSRGRPNHYSDSRSSCFHEAGYDAYCTGVVFAKMCGLLARYNYVNQSRLRFDSQKRILDDLIELDVSQSQDTPQPSKKKDKERDVEQATLMLRRLQFVEKSTTSSSIVPPSNEGHYGHLAVKEPFINYFFWRMWKYKCAEKWIAIKKTHQSYPKTGVTRVRSFDPNILEQLHQHRTNLIDQHINFCKKYEFIFPVDPNKTCEQNALDKVASAINVIKAQDSVFDSVALGSSLDDIRSYLNFF
ncbi:hypothetical protein RFI_10962, partial [Reticulomyxa filosa]